MSSVNSTQRSAEQQLIGQQLIEQRLDAIDGALLGLLPRQDRLAAVAQVEMRIRELVVASPAMAANLELPGQSLLVPNSALSSGGADGSPLMSRSQFIGSVPGGWFSPIQKRKSWLAVSAGVVGILSLALLLATPITYFVVATLEDIVGEFMAIAIMAAHAVAIALGGVVAVGLGMAALVSLRRSKQQLAGHGWAIAGLCAGPVPMLLGIAAVLVVGIQFGGDLLYTDLQPQVVSGVACPTESEPEYERGPVTLTGSESVPPEPQPAWSPSSVQAAGHEMPAVTPSASVPGTSNGVPTPTACPPALPKSDPASQLELPRRANPQPIPHPESPVEPSEMPESAPAI